MKNHILSESDIEIIEARLNYFFTDVYPAAFDLEPFVRLAEYLMEKNTVMNLTAIRDVAGIAEKHFIDSLFLLAAVRPQPGDRIIDIGCGAGFPGLPLKIAMPELDITMLDSTEKKLKFICDAAAGLGIAVRTNIDGYGICPARTAFPPLNVIYARAEEYIHADNNRDGYDYAAARAVSRLNLLCELCIPYVKKGGFFAAMKAEECGEELKEAGRAIKLLGGEITAIYSYDLMLEREPVRRNIIIIHKKEISSPVYPRPFAQIKNRPL